MKQIAQIAAVLILTASCTSLVKKTTNERPNVLWITCEDISPYLGSYGFKDARTPNLDNLAAEGIRYTNAYANAPVCAVARSTILSGMYASTLGTHQMRSRPQLPGDIPAYPVVLRQAGYYCTNNSKTDYNSNFEIEKHALWDETGNEAHWRKGPEGKPFFAVFNITVTHESQLSAGNIKKYTDNGQIPGKPRVNPEAIELPPYHPDLPEIREDWARLHDLITLMDSMAGARIQEVEDAGLADNTIVFFYSDHGGQLARSKRYIYNVGTQVPLIVYLPEKWQHLSKNRPGSEENNLVSFVDFPKTLLSITGCEIPELMQGHIFLGEGAEDPKEYVHFFRDRMAERYDFSRAVTDGHFYFIRNFMPHRPSGRDSRYGYTVQANWRAWEKYFEEGKCNEIQSQFYRPKQAMQLFDTDSDPWHVSNMVKNQDQQQLVNELSEEMDRWMIETRDVGLIPEPMVYDLVGVGKKYSTLYEYAQSSDYHVEEILEVAKTASVGNRDQVSMYLNYMRNEDPIIRYWGAYGIFLVRSAERSTREALMELIRSDTLACNRIMAAQALGLCGNPEMAFQTIVKEVNQTDRGYVFLQALNAFQYSHTDDRLTREDWLRYKEKQVPDKEGIDPYGAEYAQRIVDDALELWPERRMVD